MPYNGKRKIYEMVQIRSISQDNKKAGEYYRKRNSKNNWYAFVTISKNAPFARFGVRNPTGRGKRRIKQAILVDRRGAPLFPVVEFANRHDSKLFSLVLVMLRKSKNIRIVVADNATDVKKYIRKAKQNI